ncbi:hypothetical protein [Oceanibaculum nanhaiense]|uniref:hypothetical protein n=1 Tax=Oceanibaculum nanhaiense TaxID=1909734 RepID=UPI00396E56BD
MKKRMKTPSRVLIARRIAPMVGEVTDPIALKEGRTRDWAVSALASALDISWHRTRQRAHAKALPFQLGLRHYLAMIEESGLRCTVSGLPFSPASIPGTRRRLLLPSIDRLNPLKGYVPGNVRLTNMLVNLARNDAADDFPLRMLAAALMLQEGGTLPARARRSVNDVILSSAPWTLDPACGSGGYAAAAADTATTAGGGGRYLTLAVDNETDEGDGILYNAPFTTRRRKAA